MFFQFYMLISVSKTLYGDSVNPIDEKINFKEDDSLEIVCISPISLS